MIEIMQQVRVPIGAPLQLCPSAALEPPLLVTKTLAAVVRNRFQLHAFNSRKWSSLLAAFRAGRIMLMTRRRGSLCLSLSPPLPFATVGKLTRMRSELLRSHCGDLCASAKGCKRDANGCLFTRMTFMAPTLRW